MSALTDFQPRPVPPLGSLRKAKLPTVAERVLDNGLRVIAVRRPSVPVVQVRLRVPTAVRRQGDLAKAVLLERTMLLGTPTRDQAAIAETLQGIGGSLRVSVDADRLLLSGESLSSGVGDLLTLLAEVVTSAAYPKDEAARERDRLAEQLRRAWSQPGVVADEAWLARAFGEHPYGREHPTPEEMLDVAPSTLRATHRRKLTPDGALLVLVGDLTPARMLDRVEAALGDWTAGARGSVVPRVPAMEPGPILLVDRPGAVQSNLRVGGPAVGRTDPDFPALELANALFGGYFSSRLTRNIREDKGYTYSPHSVIHQAVGGATLLLQADVATEVTAPALLEVVYELGRIATVAPSAQEVRDTAQYLVGALALSTSTQSGLASTLTSLAAQGLDVAWLREHPQRLLSVTPEQVLEVAARYLSPARLVTTVVGDASLVAEPLSRLGDVVAG